MKIDIEKLMCKRRSPETYPVSPRPVVKPLINGMTIKDNGARGLTLHADRAGTLVRYLEGIKLTSQFMSTQNHQDWCFDYRLEDIIYIWNHGWPEATQVLEREFERLTIKNMAMVQGIVEEARVSGSYVDIEKFIEGIPENMVDFIEVEVQSSHLNILLNTDANAAISAEQIAYKGVAVAAAVSTLRKLGVSIRMYGCYGSRGIDSILGNHGNTAVQYEIMSPEYGENMNEIAIVCCNPAWIRRILFAIQDFAFGNQSSGYGGVLPLTPQYDAKKGQLNIPCNHSAWPGIPQWTSQEVSDSLIKQMMQTASDSPTTPTWSFR